MVACDRNSYSLLVAQNFLGNLKSSRVRRAVSFSTAIGEKQSTSSDQFVSAETPASKSRRKHVHSTPKRGLFSRISRIMSSDEMIVREEMGDSKCRDDDYRPGSPVSVKEGFFQRLKHTLQRAESCERIRHASASNDPELRPFDVSVIKAFRTTFRPKPRFRSQFSETVDRSPRITRRCSNPSGLLTVETSTSIEDDVITEEDYSPYVFDKFEQTLKQLTGYNCSWSSAHFKIPDDVKKEVNEMFKNEYPFVQLTFTKFNSIKRELLELASICDLDAATLAIAFVYFDKIVLLGGISKNNRKLVAGACLIIATKVTDIGKVKIPQIIEELETRLREPRKEMLSYELSICDALKFELIPKTEQVLPHMKKIYAGVV